MSVCVGCWMNMWHILYVYKPSFQSVPSSQVFPILIILLVANSIEAYPCFEAIIPASTLSLEYFYMVYYRYNYTIYAFIQANAHTTNLDVQRAIHSTTDIDWDWVKETKIEDMQYFCMVNVQIEMFNVGEDAYFVFGISSHPKSENNIRCYRVSWRLFFPSL